MNHPFCLIAPTEGYGKTYAEAIFRSLEKKNKHFTLNNVEVQKFKDGEYKPRIAANVRKRECYLIHDPSLAPGNWFTQLALTNHALHSSSAREIVNVLPYMRFSRQDRKDESRTPISARVVADSIELYADRVITLDLHNPATQGFYDIPFDDLQSFPTIITYLKEHHPTLFTNLAIMSTDVGGAKRAKAFAKRVGIDKVAIGNKTRPEAGKVKSIQIIGDLEEKVLIIDDLVDSGNTLVKAAQAARAGGAKEVYGYATHGLFTKGIDTVAQSFDKLFIGDTLPIPAHPNVEVISFIDLFAEAIHRTAEGESLSDLFK